MSDQRLKAFLGEFESSVSNCLNLNNAFFNLARFSCNAFSFFQLEVMKV